MTKFNNILVVYSGDLTENRKWFERALGRAKERNAKLRLLTLDKALTSGVRHGLISRFAPDLKDAIVKQRQAELRRTLTRIRRRGIAAYGTLAHGNPVNAILREASAHDCDLILLLANDGHDTSTIARELLRLSPVPVVLQQPRRVRQAARVLAAIKVDETRGARGSMNRVILKNAIAIARLEGAELHVAAAWTIPGEASMASPRLGIPKEQIREIGGRIRSETADAINEALGAFDLDGLRHRVHVVKGSPEDALAELTGNLKPSLIVMGSRGRSKIGNAVFGNTTARLAGRTNRPILSVRTPATHSGVGA